MARDENTKEKIMNSFLSIKHKITIYFVWLSGKLGTSKRKVTIMHALMTKNTWFHVSPQF